MCLDFWISQQGVMMFSGDNRGVTPGVDTSLSRVQLVVDLNDPGQSKAFISKTCLVGHINCRDPLGSQFNHFTVQYQDGSYSIVYYFRQSIIPTGISIPTITAQLTLSLNEDGWAYLEGAWNHSAFPSSAIWHLKYGRSNRRLLAIDVDTSFEDFKQRRLEDTYATRPED